MLEKLHQACRRLLDDGTVQVVIGYAQYEPHEPAYPLFITQPEDCDQLAWNDQCLPNLTRYLTRPEVRALGKPAVVVKACDERALVVLQKEAQIDRGDFVVVGIGCGGAGIGQPKCASCTARQPLSADVLVEADEPPAPATADRYAELTAFMQKSPAERMAYWQNEFSRCVKCYACRQTCPMCYCQRCIVDKNRPCTIRTSSTLIGNFGWHITRAFHLAGRCIGCDECTRACPAGINLRLLNLSLARSAETHFNFRAGVDPAADAVIGGFSAADQEDFIR